MKLKRFFRTEPRNAAAFNPTLRRLPEGLTQLAAQATGPLMTYVNIQHNFTN